MKTSNRILVVYGTLLAVFTFGSLGLNVQKYRAEQPAIQECLEVLQEGRDKPVLVVDADTRIAFHRSDYGYLGPMSRGNDLVRARVSGDSIFIEGARFVFCPNSVRHIVKGNEAFDVPPASEWADGGLYF
jgi:hypothetical protein